MKATAKQPLIADTGPLADFHDWLMTGRAFRKPVAVEHAEEARELLRFSRRVWAERLLPGAKHYWFEVEAAHGRVGGLERVR